MRADLLLAITDRIVLFQLLYDELFLSN